MRRIRNKIAGWIAEWLWRAVARDQRKIREERERARRTTDRLRRF